MAVYIGTGFVLSFLQVWTSMDLDLLPSGREKILPLMIAPPERQKVMGL